MENTFFVAVSLNFPTSWQINLWFKEPVFFTDYLPCVHFCENISTLSKEEKQIQAYNVLLW